MPAQKYDEPVRLPGQWWPDALLQTAREAAKRRGWNLTQWMQEAARNEIRRQHAREARDPS
jgi:hypothetical protein